MWHATAGEIGGCPYTSIKAGSSQECLRCHVERKVGVSVALRHPFGKMPQVPMRFSQCRLCVASFFFFGRQYQRGHPLSVVRLTGANPGAETVEVQAR